jgi:hypothetical protein
LEEDGFIMSLNGKHNISPGGRSARHRSSSKDVKNMMKEIPHTKLTSLAAAAGQPSSTKASRGDRNVVTVEKDAGGPPRSPTRTHPTTSTNSFI